MPTKLLEGSLVFCQVSSDTAKPVIPENPSPPPLLPNAVGWVTLASASVKVMPSAPGLLGPMKASKAAEMPTPGTAVGQKAEPTCQLVAAVSCRLAGDAPGLSWAVPLSCHPPATGDGTAPSAAAGRGEIATALRHNAASAPTSAAAIRRRGVRSSPCTRRRARQ